MKRAHSGLRLGAAQARMRRPAAANASATVDAGGRPRAVRGAGSVARASVRETQGEEAPTGGGDGRHVPAGPARARHLELPSSALSYPPRLQLRAAAAPGLVWPGLAGSTGRSMGSLDLTGWVGALGRGRDRRVDHLASALLHGSRGRCVRVLLDYPAADMPPAEIVRVRLVSIRVDAPIVEAQCDDLSQRYRGVRLRHGPR